MNVNRAVTCSDIISADTSNHNLVTTISCKVADCFIRVYLVTVLLEYINLLRLLCYTRICRAGLNRQPRKACKEPHGKYIAYFTSKSQCYPVCWPSQAILGVCSNPLS